MTNKKDWVSCPKCRRRIFRWTDDGIAVAPGARVMQPIARAASGEWVQNADAVAIAQCPRGHMASPPQEPPFA